MSRRNRTNWIKNFFSADSRPASQGRTITFQALEDRTVPAVLDWIGDVAGNANWNAKVGSNTNWLGDVLPANGDTLRFITSTAVGNFSSTNNFSNLSVAGIVMTRTGTGGTNFVLSGNAINLGAGGIIANSSIANSNTINIPFTLTADQTWSNTNIAGGSFVYSNQLNLNGRKVTFDARSSIQLNSSSLIVGAGELVKNNTGELRIEGLNSYTGKTTLNSGRISVTDGSGLGSTGSGNQTFLKGGTLSLGDGNDTFSELLVVEANSKLSTLGGNNTIAGTISIFTFTVSPTVLEINNPNANTKLAITENVGDTTNNFELKFTGTGNHEVSGRIFSSNGLVRKQGTGTLTLKGASSNNYQQTFVEEGTLALQMSGADAIIGKLTIGNGTSNATVQLLSNSLGSATDITLNPNATFTSTIADQFKSLTVNGAASFSGGGKLSVSGDVTYNGTASTELLSISGSPTSLSISGIPPFNNTTTNGLSYQGKLRINGQGGDDLVSAGSFDSAGKGFIVSLGDGDDQASGGKGGIAIFGGNGNDQITGSLIGDELRGDAGDDTITGGAGNDTIEGSFGLDSIDGGADIDTIVAVTDGNLTVNASKLDLFGTANDDSLAAVEGAVLITGVSNELIIANEFLGPIFVDSGLGNDFIIASHFSDLIFAGAGDDTVLGLPGNDSIEGGDGLDFIDGYTGDDTIKSGNGADKVFGFFGNDVIFLDGGDNANDASDGGDGNDLVFGGGGNDTLMGGNGNDTLQGEAGNDTLQGDAGNDSLLGGDNDDRLLGNAGDDTLDGGNGTDLAGDPLGTNVLLNIP